jgi:hypothetical protein
MNNPNATVQPVSTRETVRKQGAMGHVTRVYPKVYGGICEKCGVLDQNVESQDQYKLCEHYRGLSLECNYCDATKDQREVTRISKLYVYDHPTQRGADGRPALAVVCDSFTCTSKFNAEYRA